VSWSAAAPVEREPTSAVLPLHIVRKGVQQEVHTGLAVNKIILSYVVDDRSHCASEYVDKRLGFKFFTEANFQSSQTIKDMSHHSVHIMQGQTHCSELIINTFTQWDVGHFEGDGKYERNRIIAGTVSAK